MTDPQPAVQVLPELPEPWQGFQFNSGWKVWEQVIPSAINSAQVTKAYTADQMHIFALQCAEAATRAERERAIAICDHQAASVRSRNMHRGRVNQAAEFAAEMVEACAAAIRKEPACAESTAKADLLDALCDLSAEQMRAERGEADHARQ